MKKGMIKVTVSYPRTEGKTFDFEYYIQTHIPFVSKTIGDFLKGASYEKGLAGGTPDSAPTFFSNRQSLF
jgi:uncharacterized protein (TIGR02118 family)